MLLNNIKQIWSDQESASTKDVVKTRIGSIPGLNCFVGLIGATGARMFQLELDASEPVHKNYLRKFRGVEIQAIPISELYTEFTIILLDKELTDIFTMFIEDIIEKLSNSYSSREALTIINQRVSYWKKLFSKVTGELLSAEKQRGLFGELFFLKLLLQSTADQRGVINSWRGSSSANQDFARNRSAVEIKTSQANNPSVHISNEKQLDFTAWDHLFLGLISVTETTGNQNSLASIIVEIKNLLNNDCELILELEARLELAGLESSMIDNYDEISYSVQNCRFFRIQDGFPVILKGHLHNQAIYNVKYQIDTSNCSPFEIPDETVLKTMV
jgi:hypothetical protein